MEKNLKKRLKETLFATVLFFAFVHIAILVVYTAVSGKIETINIFNILNFNFFLPGIGYGLVSQLLSILLIFGVALTIFFLM